MKGEEYKKNTFTTLNSTQVMCTFLHREVSSSESHSSCGEGNKEEFSVAPPPPAADGQSTVKLTERCQQRGMLANYVAKYDVPSAEIQWALVNDISSLFPKVKKGKWGKIFQGMFLDSVIALKFGCMEKKNCLSLCI